MKIVIKKATNYQGVKRIGEEYEIADDVAKRWIKIGIAEQVMECTNGVCEVPFEDPEEIVEDETEEEDLGLDPEVEDMYEGKTNKELYELCKEFDLDVKSNQKREVYTNALDSLTTEEV